MTSSQLSSERPGEALAFDDELKAPSRRTGFSIALAIVFALGTGVLTLYPKPWISIIVCAAFIAVAIIGYGLDKRKDVRTARRQDPYRAPNYTWRYFAAFLAILWPQVAMFLNGVVPEGAPLYIAAALVTVATGAHVFWAAHTENWDSPE